jgi:pimeloyl-ACP methyl ester carboxylesterase
MIIIAAIHGIMTRQTDASWPDLFQGWMVDRDASVVVLKKEYSAGPWPRLNWVKNRRIARGLVEEIKALRQRPTDRLAIVGHSNGCVIALMALRMLEREAIGVETLILTGAACESDVRKSGVLRMTELGFPLRRAISYSSANDLVVDHGHHPLRGGQSAARRTLHVVRDTLWRWASWPYGDLGRAGWQLGGREYRSASVFTRWFKLGHSGYFAPGSRNCIFESIYQDARKAKS